MYVRQWIKFATKILTPFKSSVLGVNGLGPQRHVVRERDLKSNQCPIYNRCYGDFKLEPKPALMYVQTIQEILCNLNYQ